MPGRTTVMDVDMAQVEKLIFGKRHRVTLDGAPGGGSAAAVARQLDAVLMCAGFKCSRELLEAFSHLDDRFAMDKAVKVIRWARELVGDHVRHNTYFIDFPKNVPDTMDFWLGLIAESVQEYARTGETTVEAVLSSRGEFVVNLLSLPGYGQYQHTYEEMLERHDELLPALSDRMTIIHLGKHFHDEAQDLYEQLAASTVPLSGADLDALRELANWCASRPAVDMPVRENRAVVNAVCLRIGLPVVADTATDFLRLAAELSGGDVTLQAPVRFRSFRRMERKAFLSELDKTMRKPEKLGDVPQYAEVWKRLGERLHPHEYPEFPSVQRLFAVARGEVRVPTLGTQVELAMANRNVLAAANRLTTAPGRLWRSADWLLRTAHPSEREDVVQFLSVTQEKVSGRVLLSVREHLQNRHVRSDVSRIFVNRKGRAFATAETRDPLDPHIVEQALGSIDDEISRRLPDPGHLVVDPAILDAALPLSGKGIPEGLSVFPRGSVTPVDGELLRFFIYWKERNRRTDFDLSALFTDEQFGNDSHLSYTSLRNFAGEHSGDITSAPDGASEFINIHLGLVGRGVVIPLVYVYSGEDFTEVEESFFGFMTLEEAQRGQPFEPHLVRMRSDLYGSGATAMPLAFARGEDGKWRAKWLHLYLRGRPNLWGGHRVEENKVTVKMLTRSIMEREYLRVGYLVRLLRPKATSVISWKDDWKSLLSPGPVTYIGVEQPEDLPEGSTMYTLANLGDLIPA